MTATAPPRRPAAVEVIKLSKVAGMGSLRAFATVRIGSVVVHGCKVVQQPGQKPWCALPEQPARSKADGSGSGWFPIIEITNPELLARVRAAVLTAYSEAAA